MLKGISTIVMLEDNFLSEEANAENDMELFGYYMEDNIKDDLVELYEELNSLEKKIVNQRLHIQHVKSKLEEEEIVLKDNEEKATKHNQ
jgi:hypothetical protein